LEETMSNPLRPAHFLTSSLLAAAALATSFAASRMAQAQEKCGDTECPKGYACETGTAGCPLIDCAEGEECRTCEPAEYSYCIPAACETDADCGAHMKCAAIEQTECTGGTAPATEPCAADTECKAAPADVAEECTTTTIHQCQPEWTLPCETAADCGEGFACKEQESCWCSGSSGSVGGGVGGSTGTESGRAGAASGGASSVDVPLPADDGAVSDTGAAEDPSEPVGDTATAPPPDDQCGCEATGEFACEIVETACTKDSDCPADWTCQDNPMGSCWESSDGTSGCTQADPAKLCQPPYSDLGGGYGRGEASTGATTGGDDIAVEDGSTDNSEPPKATDPDATGSDGSGDSGEHATSPVDTDDQGAAAPEEAEEEDGASEADAASSGTSMAGGGCSMSAGSGHAGPFALVLAAAMAAFGLRRRSSR
jgi:MYXO-CTERM domain-containing protein